MQSNQSKEYKSPEFQLIRQDERNKVFFASSGGPVVTSAIGGITKLSRNISGVWS